MKPLAWQLVSESIPGLWLFRDSCNVYAVQGPGGIVIIDAGTGAWIDRLSDLPAKPVALLCTHYFRDHSAGALKAARAGIPVHVPEGEFEVFADPVHHFNARSTYIIYDNHWTLFAPIEAVPVAGVLQDYCRHSFAGLSFEIVPQPGATLTQIGLHVQLPGGARVIFSGETIHSPGRLPRMAPLQYNYNDLGGAACVYTAARYLRERKPDALLPSMGEPILTRVDEALSQLQENIRFSTKGRAGLGSGWDKFGEDPLQRVTDHVYKTTQSQSVNWFIISDSGKALVIDYGYDMHNIGLPAYATPLNRRSLLHSIEGLKKRFGIDRIDVALISHFHDDHVCGVPLLQRLFNTQCWAAENFAPLLANPGAHCFPCDWPQPIRIDRAIPLDQKATWEEYTFHFHGMNGHTRFSSLIGFEADGKRFAHTGDQYFFQNGGWGGEPVVPFAQNLRLQNHVYRNGAMLDGYDISRDWMLRWRPEIVIQGHQAPFFTDAVFFDHVKAWAEEYKEIHRRTMALGDEEAHFNIDSWGGWIWPYRTHRPTPGPVRVRVTVRNPLPRKANLEVRLVGPTGWKGESISIPAEPRAEASCELTVTPPGPCRRQPIAAELTVEGRPYGQVAEALVSVGSVVF